MEADWEASYQLTLRAAWQADNKIPNSKEASMAKAEAGGVRSDITLKAVEVGASDGYSEQHLLEKWARDSKIERPVSKAPSRSSSWWSPGACSACRRPNSSNAMLRIDTITT